MLGSDGYYNERPSEQDSSTDDEVIADSKLTEDMVNVYRVENDKMVIIRIQVIIFIFQFFQRA